MNHLGTLGTGNHFIEVCLDEDDRVWFMLHCGSRGVGNRIGTHFIELAKQDMRSTWTINLPDANLAYLPEGTPHFDDYVEAVGWAQDFARINREVMMGAVVAAIRRARACRDFARRCRGGQLPPQLRGAERATSARSLGHPQGRGARRRGRPRDHPRLAWARAPTSCAARATPRASTAAATARAGMMSRTEARRRFTVDQHAEATHDVECRKDAEVIDETPAAYKDIDAVMEAQRTWSRWSTRCARWCA